MMMSRHKFYKIFTIIFCCMIVMLLAMKIVHKEKKYTFISLFDGYKDFPLSNFVFGDIDCDHPYIHASLDEIIPNPINIFLLDTGTRKILFDTGLAGLNNSQTGKLQKSLQQAGYAADQITDICITHMHTDHIAGLCNQDGTKAFAHAKVFVSRQEVDYWLQPHNATKDPVRAKLIQKIIDLYDIEYVVAGQNIADVITVYGLSGHTLGHCGYLITIENKIIFVCGDTIHVDTVQFAHPEVTVVYDVHPQAAVVARSHILQQAAQYSWILAGVHISPPGFGRVHFIKNKTNSYLWMPIESIHS